MDFLTRTLVIDIETATVEDKPNPSKDILKFVGIRLPSGQKYIYTMNQKDQIQKYISMYPYISGHNIKKRIVDTMPMGYDMEVLERYGFKFCTKAGKRSIPADTLEIIEKRFKSMLYWDIPKNKRNLGDLAEIFELKHKKGHIDFNILKKPIITPLENKEIREYLFADLDTTYDLLKYEAEFFYGIKDFLSIKQNQDLDWLLCTSGKLGYKWFCNVTGKPEIYNKTPEKSGYQGALMWVNQQLKSEKNIFVFDFASLYPNCVIGGNLYSYAREDEEYWDGAGTIYEGYIKGKFSKIAGKFETKMIQMFKLRAKIKADMKKLDKTSPEYKLMDKQQLAIKILMNSSYGASGNPVFQSMYDDRTASSTTGIARACITFAKKTFEKHGYKIVYQHTDSLYIHDPYNDKDRILGIADAITKKQINDFNIKSDTHQFAFEDHLQKIWLVQDETGKNVCNRNVRLYDNGKFKATGITVVGLGCSKLSKTLYNAYICPNLKDKEDLYFGIPQLKEWLKTEITKNNEVLLKRVRVKTKESYKDTTSAQYQISDKYGAGDHYLVANLYIGSGKSKKKCTLEELKSVFKDKWMDAIDYSVYLKELKEFIKPEERVLINKKLKQKEFNPLFSKEEKSALKGFSNLKQNSEPSKQSSLLSF